MSPEEVIRTLKVALAAMDRTLEALQIQRDVLEALLILTEQRENASS